MGRMTDAPGDDRTIGSALRCTWQMVRRYLDQADGPRRIDNISGNNTRILIYLDGQERRDMPVYQKDFEQAFSIRRSTATRVLQLMEEKGLITRRQAAHDRRQREILLTDRARAICAEISADVSLLDAHILAGFTPEEREALFAMLARIQHNLENEGENI